MSRFTENAANIFEAAQSAARSGHALSQMTVLIGAQGGIRMIADSDWPLDSLCMHHGAEMAFRVSENGARVSVEGRTRSEQFRLEGEKPARVARHILGAAVFSGEIARPALMAAH